MVFSDEERPLSIQIYGSDPERMAAAADIVEELAPDVCDINMGCPANKVLKGCAGAALMGDLPLARRIVRAVRARLTIPLTVKFRLGLDERRVNFLDLGRMCEDEGVAAVAMHARTARQMYTGQRRLRAASPSSRAGVRSRSSATATCATPEDALGSLRADRVRRRHDRPRDDEEPLDLPADRRPAWRGRPAREPTLSERRDLMLAHFSTRSRRRRTIRRRRSTSFGR